MSRGLRREVEVCKLLRADGWVAVNQKASKGAVDILAARAGVIYCIEVKSTQGPWTHFGPRDRVELLEAAAQAGGCARLAWWPKNGKLVWIPPEDWPPTPRLTHGATNSTVAGLPEDYLVEEPIHFVRGLHARPSRD